MKDLLIEEHYCYKIHTLQMKSSVYPPFYRKPAILVSILKQKFSITFQFKQKLPIFKQNVELLLLCFFKNLNSCK